MVFIVCLRAGEVVSVRHSGVLLKRLASSYAAFAGQPVGN